MQALTTLYPIPALPSFQVLAYLFVYYGYSGQEQDLFQYTSKTTWKYAKSQQMQILKAVLIVHRFSPNYDWPNIFLEMDDIQETSRNTLLE